MSEPTNLQAIPDIKQIILAAAGTPQATKKHRFSVDLNKYRIKELG